MMLLPPALLLSLLLSTLNQLPSLHLLQQLLPCNQAPCMLHHAAAAAADATTAACAAGLAAAALPH
jgi:hypothetical protein